MNMRSWKHHAVVLSITIGAAAVASAQPGAPAAQPKPQTQPASPPDRSSPAASSGTFEGFDFGQVVEAMESSVSPLQNEMDRSFKLFTDRIQQAAVELDTGQVNEAVQTALAAIDGVLQVRDTVLNPMWDGQRSLTEQTGLVRLRLARAVGIKDSDSASVELDPQSDATLDNIAGRIEAETDPTRRMRLTAHYRTVRNLARIKAIAQRLSPNQRQLWMNVLQVLDEAALAHQQVLMGTEVLFAQLSATSVNLKEYLSLMTTVQGASELLSVVRGAQENGDGLSGFVVSMNELQDRLGAFNESVQQALEGRMIELASQIDAIQPLSGDITATSGSPVMSTQSDAELQLRIQQLRRGVSVQ